VDRDRRGLELEEDVQFDIRDERELEVLELRQDWGLQPAPRHELGWGLALRRWDATYDYVGLVHFEDVLAQIRGEADVATIFRERFEEEDVGAHVADRIRLGEPLTIELGLRYDRHSSTDESRLNPRFNLAWALGEGSVVRAAWGRFDQSQRPYELQVEDGQTALSPVERSEHRILGFEHLFAPQAAGSPALRVEVYRRVVENPRPRYENLYEPINPFPEAEPDRVQVIPDRAVAEGAELFFRSGLGSKAGWWLNYAYASTEDEIDGARVLRQFDQTHTVNLDLDFRPNDRWSLNLAWRYHTGWPTTPLSLQAVTDEDGEVEYVPVLGPSYSERLGDYHRLDLRASRRWRPRSGVLTLFLDVQNLYDRQNAAGFDYEIDEEAGTIDPDPEAWTGILPSLGVTYEF
ncbi:MAG: TonB-dependent receptor plug domain-containing protein, partial [Thermoanaerobaculia bacterium]